MDWLRYANRGATRNMPLSEDLAQKLSFLRQMGITAEVFSGGQPGIGSGKPRVGSVRHDHGNSGDMFFYRGNQRLDWANPNDQPVFQDIVRQGKAAGITGWGAGPGYMQQGAMHVGLGSPGVWGAGGRSANAPDWLRKAYGEAGQAPVPGTATPMMAQGVTPPTPGTPLAAMYGGPQPTVPASALGGLATMLAEEQSRRDKEQAEQQAEQTRRAALFGGPSPFR